MFAEYVGKIKSIVAGYFLDTSKNTCFGCELGTYQPSAQQTQCLPCPPNTSTRVIKSVRFAL